VRILQQCIYFPPEVGGLESHAFYLCRELVRLGHHVTMMTSRSQPDTAARRRWTASTWCGNGSREAESGRLGGAHAGHGAALHAAGEARRHPARADVRVGTAGHAGEAEIRLPLVITLHTSHFLRLAKKPAWRAGAAAHHPSADWLLAASEEIRDVALGLYPHPRAEALTNGVDTELFAAADARRGSGARAHRAAAAVREERRRVLHPSAAAGARELEVDAVLVGDGPERGGWRRWRRAGRERHGDVPGRRPNTRCRPAGGRGRRRVPVADGGDERGGAGGDELRRAGGRIAGGRPAGDRGRECRHAVRAGGPGVAGGALAALLRRPDLAGRASARAAARGGELEQRAAGARHEEIYETLLGRSALMANRKRTELGRRRGDGPGAPVARPSGTAAAPPALPAMGRRRPSMPSSRCCCSGSSSSAAARCSGRQPGAQLFRARLLHGVRAGGTACRSGTRCCSAACRSSRACTATSSIRRRSRCSSWTRGTCGAGRWRCTSSWPASSPTCGCARLGLDRLPAFFGGLVYMMGADLVSLVLPGGDGKLFVSALAPLLFWLTERAAAPPARRLRALRARHRADRVHVAHAGGVLLRVGRVAVLPVPCLAALAVGADGRPAAGWWACSRSPACWASAPRPCSSCRRSVPAGALASRRPRGGRRAATPGPTTYSLHAEEIVSLASCRSSSARICAERGLRRRTGARTRSR
jgi:hypothetical protein